MAREPKVLLVDDEVRVTLILEGELMDAGFEVTATNSSSEAIKLLDSERFDLLITDLSMPGHSGLDVLRAARGKRGLGMIMMTAHASFESAVEAGRLGVARYLEKPFKNDDLIALARQVIEASQLSDDTDTEDVSDDASLTGAEVQAHAEGIVFGRSSAAKKLNELLRKVAPTDSTVLLTGASGSGKEVAARMIYQLSPRRDKPFVAVNCAAIAETLLESELFGHVKGAFTGASDLKRGKFELANGGVIFLDEIGETSAALQTKLLRALEERTITRVGESEEIKCDVRVIAATNRDLQKDISRGKFREDLYFRLNVFPVHVPSLHERKSDIPEFVNFFLRLNGRKVDAINHETLEALCNHNWPGNIRELRNTIERASILAGNDAITIEHLNFDRIGGLDTESSNDDFSQTLSESERQMILQALKDCGGNKTDAARKLGITRRRLYSRLKILGIDE